MSERWIDVKDRLPFSGDDVLVAVTWDGRPGVHQTVSTSFVDDAGDWAMGSAKRWEITHWMPLPDPPTGASR